MYNSLCQDVALITMLQVMMRRRRMYNIYQNSKEVKRIVRPLHNVDSVFTAPMMSDDEGDDSDVLVPHYRTQVVCILSFTQHLTKCFK